MNYEINFVSNFALICKEGGTMNGSHKLALSKYKKLGLMYVRQLRLRAKI